jgi:hypothetical protein
MEPWHTRKDWGAATPEPHGKFETSKVLGVALHWPGTTLSKKILEGDEAAVAAALRAEQKDHMHRKPPYADIAYNAAVDQAGGGWRLRWLEVKSGANDESSDANDRYLAVTLLLNPGDKPSKAMVARVLDFIDKAKALYPNCTKVVPHSDLSSDGTDCPGDDVRKAITDGTFGGDGTPLTTMTMGDSGEEIDMNLDDRVKISNAVAKEMFPGVDSISVAGLLQYAAGFSRQAARDAAIARALAERSSVLGRALTTPEVDDITQLTGDEFIKQPVQF